MQFAPQLLDELSSRIFQIRHQRVTGLLHTVENYTPRPLWAGIGLITLSALAPCFSKKALQALDKKVTRFQPDLTKISMIYRRAAGLSRPVSRVLMRSRDFLQRHAETHFCEH